jgi:hypothetical protein
VRDLRDPPPIVPRGRARSSAQLRCELDDLPLLSLRKPRRRPIASRSMASPRTSTPAATELGERCIDVGDVQAEVVVLLDGEDYVVGRPQRRLRGSVVGVTRLSGMAWAQQESPAMRGSQSIPDRLGASPAKSAAELALSRRAVSRVVCLPAPLRPAAF